MNNILTRASVALCLAVAANGTTIAQKPAEVKLDKETIYHKMLAEPQPQGMVDENSPWLHFRIPFDTPEQQEREFTHRRYYFELSQDSTFKKGVIRSKAKSWSFYNPYRALDKGKWYWRYGVAMDNAPQRVTWSTQNYTFTITGKERKVVYPTPEQLAERVSGKGPHVYLLPSEIGKLLPQSHPDMKKRLINSFKRSLAHPTEFKIKVDTTDYPKHLTPAGIHRHFTLKTLKQFTALSDEVRTLLYAYLLTGDAQYKKKGLDGFYALDNEYHTTMMRYAKRPGFPDDFTVEQHTKTMNLILDAFSSDLTDKWKSHIVELLYKIKKDGYLNYYKQLEFSEHTVYKAHLWQMCVYTLLSSSIILAPYKEEAKQWMEYAYELWLYRNPAGSRTDGGWHAGNGYFGANERQLTFTPLFLGKLMDYNYFDHPWYQNVSKYLTYSAPYGNPGLAFGDGNGYMGSAQQNLSEVLAYIFPDNPWNLWRMKSCEKETPARQKFNLAQESVWSLLSVWNQYGKPDYAHAQAPQELAALFPDIGYVGMHTDLEHPEQNMLLNFRSCPFGQLNHAHPAQNAFNIAYGNEPLFWRTGHYAMSTAHSAYSFKHTRAHNSILADGIGQACDVSGYGWIARFATGKNISYALGDASHAYSGVDEKLSEKFRRRNNIDISRRTGFGNPGVTRFRRHIAMLRPRFVVVYDELEAKTPIQWTFRLNARDNMQKVEENHISTTNRWADADAYLFCNHPVKTEVTDQFMAVPIDVQGKLKNGKDRLPNHWHGSLTTSDKLQKTRFLTIIEVTPKGESKVFKAEMKRDDDGYSLWTAGHYQIRAQMDAAKPSFLEVKDLSGKCGLLTGQAAVELALGGNVYKTTSAGSTLLVENADGGKPSVQEKTDELPDAVVYGNQY